MHALSIFGLKFHVDRLGTRLLVLPWYASTVTYLPTTAAVPLCRRATWRSMEKCCSRAAVSSLPDCRDPGILSWLRVIWFHGFFCHRLGNLPMRIGARFIITAPGITSFVQSTLDTRFDLCTTTAVAILFADDLLEFCTQSQQNWMLC